MALDRHHQRIAEHPNVQRFSGIAGIKKLYKEIMRSWRPKDEYYIAGAPIKSFKKLEQFFLEEVHKKRTQDKVVMKILINRGGEYYSYARKNMPYTKVKFLELESDMEYGVLNDILFLVNYGEEPYALMVQDLEAATTFKEIFKILWSQGRQAVIPPLLRSTKGLNEIISKYSSDNPLLVADSFNYAKVKHISRAVLINSNEYEEVARIKKELSAGKHKLIIGIGGCTCLDAARASATDKIPAVLVPTILSTVCISVDKSVFLLEGKKKSFQTEPPQAIELSTKVLKDTTAENLERWTQSGIGDLFAKIGAALDIVFRESQKTGDSLSVEKIRRRAPETFHALEWFIESFDGYTDEALHVISEFLHDASASIILRDTFSLSGGAEHELAYALEKRYEDDSSNWMTHGKIVSIGTLIELYLLGLITKDFSLYKKMRIVSKKVGLPTTYPEMEAHDITKERIIQGIQDIKKHNTLISKNAEMAIQSLDAVFGVRDETLQ